jgi:hypothetical protein
VHADLSLIAGRVLVEVRIKKSGDKYKFKVRTSKYLYTLVVTDKAKAEKLKQSVNESTFPLYSLAVSNSELTI